MNKKYKHIALGGTFDRIHIGHHHLLQTAAKSARKLTIGLTTNKLTKPKKLSNLILSFEKRKLELESYLKKNSLFNQTSIVALNNIYGTTLSDKSIDAIAVTPQTKTGATVINKERQKQNLPKLPIITASLILDEDGGYISSTDIRSGKVDRQGMVYKNIFADSIKFTVEQKEMIKTPEGKLLHTTQAINQEFNSNTPTIIVGDVVTQYAIDQSLPFNFSVVDYYNNRQPFDLQLKTWKPKHIVNTINSSGEINAQAAQSLYQSLQKDDVLIEVDGEEDLLGFPAVLFMPLNSKVFYGQPQEGVVMIQVTEDTKDRLTKILTTK